MSGSGPLPNPERLVEGKLGRLLKEANREFAAGLDRAGAFRRVNERLSEPRGFALPRRAVWLIPAALLGLAGLVGARLAQMTDAPVVVAEDWRGYLPQAAASASAGSAAEPEVEKTMVQPTARKTAPSTKRHAEAPIMAPPTVPSVVDAVPIAPVVTGEDCLSLARLGKTRDAEACFLKRAEGSGLGAEMALYEVARLRRDVLADADGALRALAEYRTRFPVGSLRREADMSQLELLVQLGRSEDALKQSAELLSSSSSGERAAELHFLRGHILRKTKANFAAAEQEYELAEKAGARTADVKYFRALCLEALGRAAEAAALFAEYLEQPRRMYAEDARRRLEKLKP